MVHGHGARAQQLAQATRGVDPAELVVVPIDVGKHAAMALVPPIEASGGRDGWWVGEVVVDLAGDVAL
jgi:hypothetical protein